ncbi:MAG: hypothetical protein ACREJD_08250 [Phycisphaerales bacterium]
MTTPDALQNPFRDATPEEKQLVAQAVMETMNLGRLDIMGPKEYKGDMSIGDFTANVRGIVKQLLEAAKMGKRLTRSMVNFAGSSGTTGYGSAWVVGAIEGNPPTVSVLFGTETETSEIYTELVAKHAASEAPPNNRFKKRDT